jgi:hypothetical protein
MCNGAERKTMHTQIEIIETDDSGNANINPIAKRLARMPHVITLPAHTPEPHELARLIEARIAELHAEQLRLDLRDEDQQFEFGVNRCILAILKQHLDELVPFLPCGSRGDEALTNSAESHLHDSNQRARSNPQSVQSESIQLTCEKNSDPTELTEPDLQSQQHQAEPEVSRTEPGSLPSEPAEPNLPADLDAQFAEAPKKIPEGYHQIAADLYESVHRRSKFAKLTSTQRHAIYELNKTWNTESVLEIIAMPSPVGLGFRTSLAGLKRFLQDYRRILRDEQDLESSLKSEEERVAVEAAFQTANASDETFRQTAERQVRKRLFDAVNNPQSDYHEIRWLIKSLEMLNKPRVQA